MVQRISLVQLKWPNKSGSCVATEQCEGDSSTLEVLKVGHSSVGLILFVVVTPCAEVPNGQSDPRLRRQKQCFAEIHGPFVTGTFWRVSDRRREQAIGTMTSNGGRGVSSVVTEEIAAPFFPPHTFTRINCYRRFCVLIWRIRRCLSD